MKKVLVLMMILAQSAVVSAQPGEAEDQTGHTPPPIADEGGVLKGQRQMLDTTRPRIIVRTDISPRSNNTNFIVFTIFSNWVWFLGMPLQEETEHHCESRWQSGRFVGQATATPMSWSFG